MVPPAVLTRTLAVPAVPVGVVQMIVLSLVMLTWVHALPPMVTAVGSVKPVPVRVTLLPPEMLPELGEMDVTAGSAAYRYSALRSLVPPTVVTCTAALPTVPAVPVGVVQVTLVSLTTL